MRRHQVGEGQLRGAPAGALSKLQRSGNPWGLPAADRTAWADGLDVPLVRDGGAYDVLYWVGCAAAYDRRLQRIARATAALLRHAGVRFAILGAEERCTGDWARRIGDEFLFQELAAGNVAELSRADPKKIVTHCPHCLNSLKRDYPPMGGTWEVVHHSEFLAELVQSGKLPPVAESSSRPMAGGPAFTYHDPCYLARVGGVTDAPRALLASIGVTGQNDRLREMPRCGRDTACCGAGGGRMWFDDAPDERIGRSRVAEALETGAETVVVGCPFCQTMLSVGVAASDAPSTNVKDVAEVLAEAIGMMPSAGRRRDG
jgi:Fe-S oxidoreductase